MRDALSLTDQAIAYSANQVTEAAVSGMLGALDQTYMVRLLDALATADGPGILAIADEMALRSLSFSTALQDLAGLLHRIAWAQFAPASVLDEWPEAGDLRRFADTLSPEQVQLYYQIATVGRNELGLAPDEYAGFTMTLLRMLAFEPAAAGAGGSAPGALPAAGGRASAARSAQPAASAASAQPAGVRPVPAKPSVAAEPAPVPVSSPVIPAPAPRAETPEIIAAPPEARAPAQGETVAEATPVAEIAPPEPVAPLVEPAPVQPVEAAKPAEPPAVRPAPAASARAGGAAAALDVLRNAGMRVSTDRGRAPAAPPAGPAAAAKPGPRVNVPVPTPRAVPQASGASSDAPPWEDIPPDDYVPLSADEMFGAPLDDGFVPVFDSGPDDVRVAPKPAPAAPVDARPLPPAIALDAIGYDGEWPALAATLPLKGVAYQLAFNSELTAVDGGVLKLSVPVPQYADAAQVAKLKTALADTLGKPVEVEVTVGAARRTAAALDAAARAQRQREAEQEIGGDPFVQQLIREFGARIVEGSVRPLAADGGPAAEGAAPTLH